MSLEKVSTQFFTRLSNATGLPDVLYPNVSYAEQTADHLRVTILPAQSDAVTFQSNMEMGLAQISVYVSQGVGALAPARIAQDILDLFPRDLNMAGVRVDGPGYTSPAIMDGGWYIIPVSIPYQLIK